MRIVTDKQRSIKKSRLRAIDNNTCYDISARLIRLGRQIARGEHGDVRDATVIIRSIKAEKDGPAQFLNAFNYGTGTASDTVMMMEHCITRIVKP